MLLEYSIDAPLNREPPLQDLVDSFITTKGNYDRNHGPIPHINEREHSLHVDGDVKRPLKLSTADLKAKFVQHEIVAALQCAGNRRHQMRTFVKEVDGIDWGAAAVMNCRWKGPILRDVLNEAGLNVQNREKTHVAFSCYQTKVQGTDWYGGSVELERAMRKDADVLVALEMNGRPLPANHGYPVRIIVPGVSGCRSVKWLDRITVQSEESTNLYQRYDYKILPPQATDKEAAKRFWDITPALMDMPINSVVSVPLSGDTIKLPPSGMTEAKGYALPGGDQGPVVKVEVSTDEGRKWIEAEIVLGKEGQGKWCWALWKANVRLEKGNERRVLSRATDRGGNVQISGKGKWNLRGVAYNGYGESRDLNVV